MSRKFLMHSSTLDFPPLFYSCIVSSGSGLMNSCKKLRDQCSRTLLQYTENVSQLTGGVRRMYQDCTRTENVSRLYGECIKTLRRMYHSIKTLRRMCLEGQMLYGEQLRQADDATRLFLYSTYHSGCA